MDFNESLIHNLHLFIYLFVCLIVGSQWASLVACFQTHPHPILLFLKTLILRWVSYLISFLSWDEVDFMLGFENINSDQACILWRHNTWGKKEKWNLVLEYWNNFEAWYLELCCHILIQNNQHDNVFSRKNLSKMKLSKLYKKGILSKWNW